MGLWQRWSQDKRARFLAQQRPVVIMGRGHSGTRVLASLCTQLGVQLGTAPHLPAGDPADRAFTRHLKALAYRHLGTPVVTARRLRRFQRAVYRYYRRLGQPQGLWGWKFPETYLIAPYVARTFPLARYLHLVRDGRDVAFKRHLTDDPARRLGRRLLAQQGALGLPHHLQAALSWAFQVEQFRGFAMTLPRAQLFEVRFETLCQHPAEVMTALGVFLGVPVSPAQRAAAAALVDPSKVAEYCKQDPEQVRDVERCIGATLRRYGYL
ncbi:MAG: hypothetical protein KatS3mg131_0687 [Candidatus Tectimicrobiota bacterium]|nr:MAG: hypothetical protein KatS3mg131_0687 [Candidatus Tectomicrobia bacterium]